MTLFVCGMVALAFVIGVRTGSAFSNAAHHVDELINDALDDPAAALHGRRLYTYGRNGQIVTHEPGEFYLSPTTSAVSATAADTDPVGAVPPSAFPAGSPLEFAAALFEQHKKSQK